MMRSNYLSFMAIGAVSIISIQLASRPIFDKLLTNSYPVHNREDTDGAVFITGCSSGIGRNTAIEMIKHDYHVFATIRKEQDANSLIEEATKLNKNDFLHPIVCDVTDEEDIKKAKEIVSKWLLDSDSTKSRPRTLIGIVNNAGTSSRSCLIENMTVKDYNFVMDTNLKGPILVYQAFLPLLRTNSSASSISPPGRVVNVGSLAGKAARPFRGPYTISKFALEGLSDTQRAELLLEGISVSMVNPGYVKTNINTKYKNSDEETASYGMSELQMKMFHKSNEYMKKAGETGADVSDVTIDIMHALLDPNPKTRYYPGSVNMGPITASMLAKLLPFLPDRLLDKIMVKK